MTLPTAMSRHAWALTPSVLVAEDLQWFDPIHPYPREADPRRALIGARSIMTARPGADPMDGIADIELEALTDLDSGELVDALSTGTPLNPELRESLIARSDGIPLYIEELVANAQHGAPSGRARPSGHRRKPCPISSTTSWSHVSTRPPI